MKHIKEKPASYPSEVQALKLKVSLLFSLWLFNTPQAEGKIPPSKLEEHHQAQYVKMLSVGYTAMFIESKNFEVNPLNIQDLTGYFLQKYNVTPDYIVKQECRLRSASNHEFESATYFCLLMWLMRAWKY